jgi:hypothetical protein
MQLIDLTSRYKIARGPLDWTRVDGGAWHHSVTATPTAGWTQDQELAVLDVIDRYHRLPNWRTAGGELVSLGGFAYHLAVFPSRRLYLVTPLGMRGAHVAGHNGHLVAVVLIGTFTNYPPLRAQLETAIEARGYVEHHRTQRIPWKGHRGWADKAHPTACPGATQDAWVPQLSMREEVRTVYTDDQINRRFIALGEKVKRLEAAIKKLGARPAPKPKAKPTGRTYTVKASDGREGLSGIALRELGDAGRWPEIAKLNGLKSPYTIHTRQKLQLPPR